MSVGICLRQNIVNTMKRQLNSRDYHFDKRRFGNINMFVRNLKTMARDNRAYTPRRAMMYVPGNDVRKVQKIPSLGADCIVLDCEDGVALNRKEEARNHIRQVLDLQSVPFGNSECSVRVNSVDSGLCQLDLDVIMSGANLPPTLHLPKVDTAEQLDWFADMLLRRVANRECKPVFNLVMFIESARALVDLPRICERADTLTQQGAPFIMDALVFGSDDFCADIGATRTPEAKELLYARQYLVTVAKAFRVQAIDLVYINYKDLEGLKSQAQEGARMGFTGKQVIHPGQVPVVQESFSPSTERIQWANELTEAFREHQASGQGAFTFRGHMIDMPLLLQARNVLQMAAVMQR